MMTFHQARAFAERVIGSELCTGAGEDESATYFVSPVARAFVEGAIGSENTPFNVFHASAENLIHLGQFFLMVGSALKAEGEKRMTQKGGA